MNTREITHKKLFYWYIFFSTFATMKFEIISTDIFRIIKLPKVVKWGRCILKENWNTPDCSLKYFSRNNHLTYSRNQQDLTGTNATLRNLVKFLCLYVILKLNTYVHTYLSYIYTYMPIRSVFALATICSHQFLQHYCQCHYLMFVLVILHFFKVKGNS